MGLRLTAAKGISAVSTWGLKNLFKRPAANFPGKIALYVDTQLIADLSPKMRKGSMVVCGTNGKTTVTNLVADALELAGKKVVCNRTGANLDSGVATALLHSDPVDWGVFECDELWVAKVLPQLKSNYLLLLNLFRDQLDRVGEINVIQESIAGALKASPKTVLVYNADDPLCAAIAARVENKSIAFGVAESMGLDQNTVVDAQMCQMCSGMLEYSYRQYGQLGEYRCTQCDFGRKPLEYSAHQVSISAKGISFAMQSPQGSKSSVSASYSGAYMVYNLLASAAAADLAGCPSLVFQEALDAFNPQNGRLQNFDIEGHDVLLNLAKNPTGFNQNLKLILQDKGPKVVAFYVNDKEGDGRDISWLWDIDFEELASQKDLKVFVGGMRRNDLQVRLKYAGVLADRVENASDVFLRTARFAADRSYYFVANYTALPPVREELSNLASQQAGYPASEAPVSAGKVSVGESDSRDSRG